MGDEDQRDYLSQREREEIAIAITSEDNAAAKAHLKLASLYRERLNKIGSRSRFI